ncbi:MAG: hypothetical protein ACE5KO_01360 [Candidatus Bathyarchaeia archaeon]
MTFPNIPSLSFAFLTVLATVFGLLLLWIVATIPVWIAAKVVTGGRANFGRALIATLVGPIVYGFVLLIALPIMIAVGGPLAVSVAAFFAFIALLAVYKSVFSTGWLGSFAIAVLAVIILLSLVFLVGGVLGFTPLSQLFGVGPQPSSDSFFL